MKLPRPAFILSVVVAAVLIVAGFGALLLPRIVDSQNIRENVSAELAKRFAALTSNVAFLAIVEGRRLRIGEIGWWRAILAILARCHGIKVR
jgi:predicted PurR-regulated permease PerM